MPYKKGDVVLVPFPFSDIETHKKRPAVVIQCDSLNRRLDTVIIAQATSNTSRAEKERSQVFVDTSTPDGRRTGLLTDSAIKCETVATLSKNKILKTLGRLNGPLRSKLDDSIRSTFDI